MRYYGSKIRKIREEKGMSIKELSEKADITYQTLLNIETEVRKDVGMQLLNNIAHVLGCGIEELYAGNQKLRIRERRTGLKNDEIEYLEEILKREEHNV